MCEFCVKHGEGEKWYLQAKNYSEDMLNDLRRRRFLERFSNPEELRKEFARSLEGIERIRKAPRFVRALLGRLVTGRMKRIHFGQVVPIEEIEEIFGFTNSIVRLACLCRKTTFGKEKRYCYGISMGADGGRLLDVFRSYDGQFAQAPVDGRFEVLSRHEALALFRDHEKEGLCHTVWTFHTPFIGGICNCDRVDCLALRTTVSHEIPVLFRAEYIAAVDPDACSGCRQCMRLCQFGGLSYRASARKVVVDPAWCYGCGVCRSGCAAQAIRLEDRASSPAGHLW